MAGVALGTSVWSFMTGVAMVKSGMSVAESVLMALLVYAGSAQLAALPLIAAAAPLWVIWLTALCVNLRFVVFSLHLRAYLIHLPLLRRLLLGYTTGDLSYVLLVRRFPAPGRTPRQRRARLAYLWGGNALGWCSWQAAGLAGIFAGHAMPPGWGLEFAGTLALLGVTLSLAGRRLRGIAALVAGAAAVAAHAMPYRLGIVAAIAAAVSAGLALAGLTALTVITRCLFFISARPLPMPRWLERGLQYAPIAALAAVVAPDVLALQMQDFFQWRDARLWAALAAALFYRQFQGRPWTLPGVIGAGMAVYVPLRLGLGWG